MSGRVPNKIALPTGGPSQPQQSNRVPDQIALPTGGRDPTQPSPPQQLQPQHFQPQQPQPQQLQPQQNTWAPPSANPSGFQSQNNTYISPYQPAYQPPQNGYQLNPPQQVAAATQVALNWGPYGYQPAVPGQRPYVEPQETILPPAPPANFGNNTVQNNQQQQQQQQQEEDQDEPDDSKRYYKTCNTCRRRRRKCSGTRPCKLCVTADEICVFEVLVTKKPTNRKRTLDAVAGGSPDDDANDNGEGSSRGTGPPTAPPAKRKKSVRFASQPLTRVRPRYDIPENGNCEHCEAGGHEGRACDANHAEQIECSQCTKYRNLVDPNHVCRVAGGEYWQKRFANSRPAYPMSDTEASCCVGCRVKRAGHKPAVCDIDIQVKIGCSTCSREGRLCEADVQHRANGQAQEPWEQMWDRPRPGDSSLVPGRRPWWRRMCQGCISDVGTRRWNPCSWLNDVRLDGYKCLNCVEQNRPCVDTFTNQEFVNGYLWDGQSDCLIVDGRSVPRNGAAKCENCRVNRTSCRGSDGPNDFACSKCTAWGLTCVVKRDGQPVHLPHPDRKAIGWTRNCSDTGHLFLACVPCRINKRNCDRKRPCDSCVKFGSECDEFLDNGAKMRRDQRVTGADSADYYMALGYGPDGVDSNRWNTPVHELVGPNRPRWVSTAAQPTQQQLAAYEQAEGLVQNPAQHLPDREFGGVEPEEEEEVAADGLRRNPRRSTREKKSTEKAKALQPRPPKAPKQPYNGPKRSRGRPRKNPLPTPVDNGVGEGYDNFWKANGHSGVNDNGVGDDSGIGLDPSWTDNNIPLMNNAQQMDQLPPQQYFGDNLAASRATENGQNFESWLSDFNDHNAYNPPLQDQVPAPFESPPDLSELQRFLGQDVVMNESDAEELANAVIDPALYQMADDVAQGDERQEQSQVLAELRLAVLSFSADQRFVPVELRNLRIPEVSDPPASAQVPAPERFLLQLNDANGAPPAAPFSPDPAESSYIQNIRNLLTKWKRPGWNVLGSIPDLPLAESNPQYTADNNNRTCEEYQAEPITGDLCRNEVPPGDACESLEHAAARAAPFMVCDPCDGRSKMGLFQGTQPLTRGEFLRMRAYACANCAQREIENGGAAFGMPGRPTHPVTGCACATKVIGRRLCVHHRYRLAKELMVQTMFVSEWAITNFGHQKCIFCKVGPARTDMRGDVFGSLVYLCLNCQGIVAESNTPHVAAGVEGWLGGTVPESLKEQAWMGMATPPENNAFGE